MDDAQKSLAWSMHCRGLPPSEIAKRLKVKREQVVEAICEKWSSMPLR